MAIQLERIKLSLHSPVGLLLPLGLWALLWLGLQPGNIRAVLDPESPTQFLHGLRAAFPFAAAWAAVVLMLVKRSQRSTRGSFFFSPLGLAAVYGLLGVGAAVLSPQWTVALYWAALYLTVPLILWAAVWGADSLGQIRRIIQFNWLIIVLGFAALFVLGLLYLNLGDSLLKPSNLLRCQPAGNWFVLSSGFIRGTGVGRYAAITGIIAISLLWRGNLRVLWGLILLASVALLLTTVARTSIVGFAVAAPVVVLLLAGRKAMIGGALALAVLVPLVWSTGIHETFLRGCILRGWDSAQEASLNLRTPAPSEDLSKQALPAVEGESGSLVILKIPLGGVVLNRFDLDTDGQVENREAVKVLIPSGWWASVVLQDGAWTKVTLRPSAQETTAAPRAGPGTTALTPSAPATSTPVASAPATSTPVASASNTSSPMVFSVSTPMPTKGGTANSVQEQISTQAPTQSANAVRVEVPAGVWVVQSSETPREAPVQEVLVSIPAKGLTLELLSTENQNASEIPTQDLAGSFNDLVSTVLETSQPPNRDERTSAALLRGQTSPQQPSGSAAQSSEQTSLQQPTAFTTKSEGLMPDGFYTLTGRTKIWAAGWEFIKRSPVLGYGFHADRLVLGTHMHNAVLHAMIQTGILGTIPFVAALLFGWFLLLKALRKLSRFAPAHKTLVIQAAGILVFLSVRALPESTGAFFGIDWLLLSPLLLYLRLVNSADAAGEGAL